MTLIQRVHEKRNELGLSVRALEQKANLSNGTLKKWETQKASYDKVADIADTLNVSVQWLITGKEAGEPMTEDEQQLVNYYRQSDDRGKRNILRTAQAESEERNIIHFRE
ncbi:MAG: helix-turn-helix domain-containing protein [Lachnoclostridium sp.]|nr:helix-turn-helix domain-containing protein [Lachnospira sp.]MCM1247019.1 helix-turn-helix domain-containing protein [Lachnoclostridium sp.]